MQRASIDFIVTSVMGIKQYLRFDIKIGDQNFNEITRPLTKHELACLREHFETGLDPNQVGANGWTLMMHRH